MQRDNILIITGTQQEVYQGLNQGGKGPLNEFTGPIPLPVGQPGEPGPIGPEGTVGLYVSIDCMNLYVIP